MTRCRPAIGSMTPGKTIGESDINLFAGLVGDFTPIHVDAQFAAASPSGPESRMDRSPCRPRSAC